MPEFLAPTHSIPLLASTGIASHRVVNLSTNGGILRYPANGGVWDGVTWADSSTGSTEDGQVLAVQVGGVALIEAAGSTVAAGDLVAASSVGRVIKWTTGKIGIGKVVDGSSGSTGRLLSVLLYHLAHSTAI